MLAFLLLGSRLCAIQFLHHTMQNKTGGQLLKQFTKHKKAPLNQIQIGFL